MFILIFKALIKLTHFFIMNDNWSEYQPLVPIMLLVCRVHQLKC